MIHHKTIAKSYSLLLARRIQRLIVEGLERSCKGRLKQVLISKPMYASSLLDQLFVEQQYLLHIQPNHLANSS